MKRALVTGISGQDGSYLTDLLLERGYDVYGLVRRKSKSLPLRRSEDIVKIYGDMTDMASLVKAIKESDPEEIYNLAAQSHVGLSFKQPVYTTDVNACGVVRLLEAVKEYNKDIKIYQASTSEMFGKLSEIATENTPFHTRSPYGASKLFAHNICNIYRESYNMFICCGILFNHESPRRGKNFVTRKIAKGIVDIAYGNLDTLYLGNLNSMRDWGYAGDYVKAMWLMMQQSDPDDYVIATGEAHSVREFVNHCVDRMGLDITWGGEGLKEIGIIEDKCNGCFKGTVQVSEKFFRPNDVTYLKGDPSRARHELNWYPAESFEDLVHMMVDEEVDKLNALY
jgi:GDPmannose 4,6-dehydratase